MVKDWANVSQWEDMQVVSKGPFGHICRHSGCRTSVSDWCVGGGQEGC